MGAYVFDTNALLRGLTLGFAREAYTTPSVMRELKNQVTRTRLSAYISSKKLRVAKPSKRMMLRILEEAKKIGEEGKLSKTDVEVAALGLALQSQGRNPTVLTDDYSLQNLLSKIGVRFKKVGLRGIRRRMEYVFVCKNCNQVYRRYRVTCCVCGAPVLRKAIRKEELS